ncbi:MAG: hypothetical protein KDD43_00150, partial [Bdellovibrionales bacterium]|nr:hypothetical protein [Bdellovibrionales bacterium]
RGKVMRFSYSDPPEANVEIDSPNVEVPWCYGCTTKALRLAIPHQIRRVTLFQLNPLDEKN